ncbi:MAG: hypothetical protein U9N73_00890 [Candidatus Auribacterota bacterium]|nr:hypothetical protein [Candidatus Auribacterota bacterium]
MGIKNFYRGDTKKYKLKIRDKQTGDPISVNGGQLFLTFKVKNTDDDADAVIQKIINCTEANPAEPTGEVELILSSTETNITPGTYCYDFQFVSSEGEVMTILSDKVKVLVDITRSV